MRYDLNQLGDPKKFQRLVNAILVARFGENARLTPLDGTDGGSDGETADGNPHMEFRYDSAVLSSHDPLIEPPRPGRYLFQAKYHRTGEQRLADLRSLVVREFKEALRDDVLRRQDRRNVNYFVLVTNVPASEGALRKMDAVRRALLRNHRQLHAEIWWRERITASLDWSPNLWHAFPELFPGLVPPLLGTASKSSAAGLSRTLRLAVSHQHDRDCVVKFRQIELQQQLLDLFVDLDVIVEVTDDLRRWSLARRMNSNLFYPQRTTARPPSALEMLINDDIGVKKILLEGGPGQGKSTVTQMAAQIYREKVLGRQPSTDRDPTWHRLCQLRIPIRIELRDFAQWLSDTANTSLEQFIAYEISRDSGGASVTVEDVHAMVERSSVILLLDGLDEIGNEIARDRTLDAIAETVSRFEKALQVDLRVVLTTRPPAVAGRWDKLDGFTRVILTPMNSQRIDDYLDRWLGAQIPSNGEQERIRASFAGRRDDPHVDALARNPMQLSVLLQFIYLKGEAFPDRRAELYRDYFQIVIDRDVEKSPELREHRDLVEGLHSFLGFRIHGMTEIENGGRTLDRNEIVRLAGQWLDQEGHSSELADKYFALGEERFGLIVARSGEAQETSYGFEVQPIQEYFAAAYISDRTDADAHDIFQLLIHRSYWREVALFLAGLRRPNEKADLVARAKIADNKSTQDRQRHSGKVMVLQLMQEGVLTQPRHVLSEALNFVMKMVNPVALRAHPAPQVLMRVLSELIGRYGDAATRDQIAHVTQQYSESNDYHLLALIHRLAADVLAQDLYIEAVLEYDGRLPEPRALVRLTCPYVSTLERLATDDSYWQGMPTPVLARHYWEAVERHGLVRNVAYPRGMHLSLVLQFAIGQLGRPAGEDELLKLPSGRVPAIWKLQQHLQAIELCLAGQKASIPSAIRERLGDATLESWEDGTGETLPDDVGQCLRDLIEASSPVVSLLADEHKERIVAGKIVAYLEAIENHLRDPGIAGWVACRCACWIVPRERLLLHRYSVPRELINAISDSLFEYYDLGDVSARLRWHYQDQWLSGPPLGLRVTRGASVRRLDGLIADDVHGRLSPHEQSFNSWLGSIPIPMTLVRPLVDACRSNLRQLLRLLGERGAHGALGGPNLKVQDTQRILKTCRKTNDLDILRGAAFTLVKATFARIAAPALMVKILSAAPSSPLVPLLLRTTNGGASGRRLDTAERELAGSVARLVLNEPELHPFRIVNRAAAVAAEIDARDTTPLFEECPGLVGPDA